jgi:hypothetical protein
VIKVEKEEVVTYTIQLSEDRAEHLKQWLTWAFEAWTQIQKTPQLNDEIFYDVDEAKKPLHYNKLNYDTLIMINNRLK